MNDTCQRYLEDPESNAVHLRDCEDCRALFEALAVAVEERHPRLSVDDLPLASWEGAGHRPWGLVAAAAIAVLALSILFFIYAGTSPLGVVSSEMTRLEMLRNILRLTGTAVRNAPAPWQITIGVLFIVVNTVLVLLLRRAPRGIDA